MNLDYYYSIYVHNHKAMDLPIKDRQDWEILISNMPNLSRY